MLDESSLTKWKHLSCLLSTLAVTKCEKIDSFRNYGACNVKWSVINDPSALKFSIITDPVLQSGRKLTKYLVDKDPGSWIHSSV